MNERATAGVTTITVLGDAFDPATNAHMVVAERVAAEGIRVVFLPCADRHVFGKCTRLARQRAELLELAVGDRFDVSLIAIESSSSRAVDLRPHAVRRYGPVPWVIGNDNAECLHQWVEGEGLKRELPFIVVGRGRIPLATAGQRWHEAADLVPGPFLTRIRGEGWSQSS